MFVNLQCLTANLLKETGNLGGEHDDKPYYVLNVVSLRYFCSVTAACRLVFSKRRDYV
jgi:hypothetical protein